MATTIKNVENKRIKRRLLIAHDNFHFSNEMTRVWGAVDERKCGLESEWEMEKQEEIDKKEGSKRKQIIIIITKMCITFWGKKIWEREREKILSARRHVA